MPKLSVEATIGLMFEVLLAIVDHLHIHEPLLIWGLFSVGVFLIADSIIRGEWAHQIVNPKQRKKRRVVWACVALAGFIAFGLWVYARTHSNGKVERSSVTPPAPLPKQLEPTPDFKKVDGQKPTAPAAHQFRRHTPELTVQMDIARAIITSAEGNAFYLSLQENPGSQATDGFAEIAADPGKAVPFTDINGIPPIVRKFKITNYASVSLFNCSIDLHVVFQEAMRKTESPNSAFSGGTTSTLTWKITIPKIDPGPEHAFIFYATNGSNRFATLTFPNQAVGRFADESKPQNLRLVKLGSLQEAFALSPVR